MQSDQGEIVGSVLLNFSKHFQNVTQDLLTDKLDVCGLEKRSPSLPYSYLNLKKYFSLYYSPVPNNRWGLNKRGRLSDSLNINKGAGGGGEAERVQIKGGLKNALSDKWQPIITNYGCLKENILAPSRYS